MTKQSPATLVVLQVAVLVVLVSGVPAGPAAGVGHPETDNTVTRIELNEDGSARWIVQIRMRLDSNESVESFERFQRRFSENRSAFLGQFRDRMRNVLAGAATDTGREMSARNFTAETSLQELPRRWGVVRYAFTWENFAQPAGDRLVMADAFDGGFFIAANDSLQVVAPPGYAVESASPDPDATGAGTVTWTGRHDFADEQPATRFVPAEQTGSGGADRLAMIGGGLVLLALAGGVGYVLSRDGFGTDGGDGTGGVSGAPRSDGDRVRQLLADSGGRMKQNEIVERVDWSKSKVSRVVGRLADDGEVRKTRIGRENVVELDPETDADGAGSSS